MKFETLPVLGCRLIVPEVHRDDRGSFARIWCEKEFADAGIGFVNSQFNLSVNAKRGTLRGMHLQKPPHAEAKIVRCTKGSIYDVMLDLRPASPTYLGWHGVELSADNQLAVLIPEGCAHGFQSLEDDTHVYYQMSAPYAAEAASGVRWNDPAFGIRWPLPAPILNPRDAGYADFKR
jgi:dTDP-4-dehydrorhamnose 3,5-epimerase